MSTSVKHIHNGMRGAPQISGTVGAGVIPVLEALFITGWGATTAVSVSVASGTATATLTSGETFDRDSVVLIAGATPGELNGEARVLTTSLTSITWATTAADGVATGTITIKYAPQTDWVKVYAGTNKAAYRSTHVQSAGHFLRVDDTGALVARVRGYEAMTDVDTGTGPFPTDAQISGGGYIHKAISGVASAIRYKLFCDERFVFICIAAASVANALHVAAPARGFGDPIVLAPGGDAWGTVLSAAGSSSSIAGQGSLSSGMVSTAGGFCVGPRAVSALGGAVLMDPKPFVGSVGVVSGGDSSSLGVLPSEVDGQVKTSKLFLKEQAASKPPRVVIPGVGYVPQGGAYGPLADGDTMDGAGDLAGRRLMAVADLGNNNFQTTPQGVYLVDITGPWR
jgi:hypothetical protein